MTQEVIVIGIGIVVAIVIVARAIAKIKQIQQPHQSGCTNGCTGCKQHLSEKEEVIENIHCTAKKK